MTISSLEARWVIFEPSSEEEIINIWTPGPKIKKVRTLCFSSILKAWENRVSLFFFGPGTEIWTLFCFLITSQKGQIWKSENEDCKKSDLNGLNGYSSGYVEPLYYWNQLKYSRQHLTCFVLFLSVICVSNNITFWSFNKIF